MAHRFVRSSKYRHVFGKPTRKEFCYDNLHISRNAWDTNLVKVNPKFLSVNWEAGGGGSFAVIPLEETGKLPEQIPLFRGHTATVLDTDWNPFNDNIIASASDDTKIFIWQVPKNFTVHVDAEEVPHVEPILKLTGHARKVGQVLFNPAAENILASASGDFTIKIWDIEAGQSHHVLRHSDIVQSLTWNATGTLLATTSRDKKLRVWDVRQERAISEHPGHQGAKNSRAVWMGEHNRIATTGFSRMSERQIALWEPGNPEPIGGFTMLDSISGVCMPFWDDGSNCLYLAGKGDGNIRYYEYENDKFEYLTEYKSGEPQRGIGFLPRRGLNLHENEIMRAYKTVNDTYIEPISFTVPRRAETFQSDLYPPATGIKPAVSAKEWLDGKSGLPAKIDLESLYDGNAPVEVPSDYKPPAAAASTPPSSAKPAQKEFERPKPAPAPAPTPVVARAAPPSSSEQKASISAMADKYKEQEEEESDDDETSSFEEVSRPAQRAPPREEPKPAPRARSPPEPVKAAAVPVRSIPAVTPAAAPVANSPSSGGASDEVSTSLREIKRMIEAQGEQIGQLRQEVETLRRRVVSGGGEQSERIRQLELELEAARS
ncbi:probable coronin [Cephalotrichum gorgonifer]|uniref:Coronin n=1 Tax=Cephalotrichum gorgonifer TaxID=2041049 RepID=A0AAE8MQR7_9PEZI|nr:probable coronin [Cephalotrichum gorgonifer]